MAKEYSKEYKRKVTALAKKRILAFERHYRPWHDSIRDYNNLYESGLNVEKELSDYYYDFKLIYSIIRGLLPSLVLSDPDLILKPKKDDAIGKVKAVEKVLNYYWQELKLKKEMKRIVLDTLKSGLGIAKLGWTQKTKYVGPSKQDDCDVGGQQTFHVNEFVKENDLFVKRVNCLAMRWDIQASSFEDARWVAEQIIKPVEAVKRSEIYEKSVREELQGSSYGMQDMLVGTEGESRVIEEDPDSYVALYEVHDKERNILLTISMSCEDPLRFVEYPYPMLDGTHYETLRFHELTDKIEGLSLVGLLAPQQKAINRVRSYQVDHVRRVVPKLLVSKMSGMTDADLKKLANAEANTISQVEGNVTDVALLQGQPIPQDTYSVADIIRSDMLQTSGTPPSRFGLAAGGRTSATEIKSMDSSEQFRIEDMRTETEDFASAISRKMIQILCAMLDDKQVFTIVGDKDFVPIKYTKEDLRGEFDYSVAAGSMARSDRSLDRQQLINLYQLAAADPTANKAAILKDIVDTFPNIKDKDRYFIQPTAPEPAPAMPGQAGPIPSEPSSPVDLQAAMLGQVGKV